MSDSTSEPAMSAEALAKYAGSESRWTRARRRGEAIAYPTLAVLALIGIWELGVLTFNPQRFILPNPWVVAKSLTRNWHTLLDACIPTLTEIGIGFGLSIAIGIPLAVAIVSSRMIEKTLFPILVVSQAVPKVALSPLFLVWFGFDVTPKGYFTFLIAFFALVVDTVVGLKSVPVEMIDLGRSMGASRPAIFAKIRCVHALPNIFGGLKVTMTLCVVGAIVAELSGSQKGLGHIIQFAQGQFDTPLIFAAVVVSGIIGILLYFLVEIAERLAIPWHVSARGHQA